MLAQKKARLDSEEDHKKRIYHLKQVSAKVPLYLRMEEHYIKDIKEVEDEEIRQKI